jgi:hypothetical protein
METIRERSLLRRMIEKIYNGLLNLYRAAKRPVAYTFIGLFIVSFGSTIIWGSTPTIFHWPWIILGGSMILFAFIMGLAHILLGIKLKAQGKLDEEGNMKEEFKNK